MPMKASYNRPIMNLDALLEAARRARLQSYSPYSGFAVGAALLARDGSIFTGTNLENRSFGLALCAERVALGTAVTAGCRDFLALALLTDTNPPTSPCGACREVLAEFCSPEFPIHVANLEGVHRILLLRDLLPERFELPVPAQPSVSSRVEEVFAASSNSGCTRRGKIPAR